MLTRTRRLLGFAKSTSSAPIVFDPRLELEHLPDPEGQPYWQDDLDSLCHLIDSRMAERRAIVSLSSNVSPVVDRRGAAPAAPVSRVPLAVEAGASTNPWIGFGLEDPSVSGPARTVEDQRGVFQELVSQVAGQLRDEWRRELTEVVRQAVREAVDLAFSERLSTDVRHSNESALKDIAAIQPRRAAEHGRSSRSGIVTIRVNWPPSRARGLDLSRP